MEKRLTHELRKTDTIQLSKKRWKFRAKFEIPTLLRRFLPHSNLYLPAIMPRVVPIIHRAPPPPLEQTIAAPVPPIVEPESVDRTRSFLTSVVPKNHRRSYISATIDSNGSSQTSKRQAKSAKVSGDQRERHFTLFDALQEVVRPYCAFASRNTL